MTAGKEPLLTGAGLKKNAVLNKDYFYSVAYVAKGRLLP